MNKKSLVLSSVLAGLGILGIVVLFIPWVSGIPHNSFVFVKSFLKSFGEIEAVLLMVGYFMAFVTAVIVTAVAVVKVLRNINVIKTTKLDKPLHIVALVLAIIGVVTMTISFIFTIIELGFYFVSFLSLLISIATLVFVILSKIKKTQL